ncbi:hypothetical protein F183_A07270 [Bryobacterales bacterium F-183]|nr:hypothetical protein F183_A07270 [Bryobacterales bacterium F-183]
MTSCPPAQAEQLLDIVEAALHASSNEWIFLRELRIGTGFRKGSLQRLDAFALNSYAHTGMRRVCYEVKCSRGDFLGEMKQPLKRRIGMRYSNEFYFVTPPGLVQMQEIPAECGWIEAGYASPDDWRDILKRQAGFFYYDPATTAFCILTVPAPWRDTPGPTWQLLAAMLRHQRRQMVERPPEPPSQQKIQFES